ncbi:MAG: ATP-binding protein [Candidatus Hermodarchaeota archaeon]
MNQTLLTINAYIALVAALVNFVFAILVIARTSRTTVYITFFFICISVMFWNFGDFMVHVTGKRLWTLPSEAGSQNPWKYISSIGSVMVPAFMFHLVNALIMLERRNAVWIMLAYIFSGLLALSCPFEPVHPVVQRIVGGVTWNILFFVLLFPFILWGIVMVIIAINRTRSEDEKSRLRYFIVATIIAVFTGLTDLVQKLKVPVPPLGHLGSVVYPSILAMSIFKYRKTYDVLAEMRMKLKVLSEMAAGIAHEIGNPLSCIEGASNLLANELKNLNHPKIQEYHNIIGDEIKRLNNILFNFQDLTKPLKIERESASINEVIQKTVKLAELGTLNIRVRLELSRDLPKIQADASLINQVFLNLIKNAAETCGSDGELLIKTESIPSWVKISFSDDGPGIRPELLNRIFEPFFTTKTTGMGMGLAICQRIIQAHNGRIEVNSLLPKGTDFSIFLPE